MAIAAKLSQLSKSWKRVQPITPSFATIPDNDYVADLKEMQVEESKKSGRLQVVSTYEIADGEFDGKTIKRFDGLDSEQSMGYFKGYCAVIGLELPDDMELLQESMDEFIANNKDLFDIRVVTNGQYQNVYINGVSEFAKGGEEEEVVEEVEEVVEEVEEVEEVVEEVEQEISPPQKKFLSKVLAKLPVKVVVNALHKKGIVKKK